MKRLKKLSATNNELYDYTEEYKKLSEKKQFIVDALMDNGYDFEEAIIKCEDCILIDGNTDEDLGYYYVNQIDGGVDSSYLRIDLASRVLHTQRERVCNTLHQFVQIQFLTLEHSFLLVEHTHLQHLFNKAA